MDQRIIEETIRRTSEALASSLKKHGMLKSGNSTPFQKTETLLYNYRNFKRTVHEKSIDIETIRLEGLPQRSKSITSFTSNVQIDTDNDFEKAEAKIEKIEAAIEKTKEYIQRIDTALAKISNDPHFDIIRLKYFEEQTREQISDEIGVDVSTVTRNKNRLINVLKIYLFSEEVMYEMFGVV